MSEDVGGKVGQAQDQSALFTLFNEIGIINQLSSTLFQQRLPDGVTVAQFSVLNHLTRVQDGQTPLRLASAFQVPKTSMTHSIAELERRGLVKTEANPEDGRSKCVWLTGKGKEFREQAIRALIPDLKRLAPHLGPDEVAELLPHLVRIRKILDEDRNA